MENSTPQSSDCPIAIIGLSCRFPGSDSGDEYFDILLSPQQSSVFQPLRQIDGGRSPADNGGVRAGLLKQDVTGFDAEFFRFSAREANATDPQQRLLLETAWEGLENGGLNPLSLRGKNVAVFTGISNQDYKTLLIQRQPPQEKEADNTYFRNYFGNSASSTSSKISHFLGLTGPNVVVDAACSTSFLALHLACENLRNCPEVPLAIASGVNLILLPYNGKELYPILSPTNRSMPFSAEADGFVRSEGVASLILKRLDTVQPTERVLGIIRGTGICYDGLSPSMGSPTIDPKLVAMQMALKQSRVNVEGVTYVECHATGKAVGDGVEVAAVTEVYGLNTRTLLLGSAKGGVGHTEGCSGLASLVKVIKAFEREVIPGQNLGDAEVSSEVAGCLSKSNAEIPKDPVSWPRSNSGQKRVAGVANAGLTGTDVHIVIEEPPAETRSVEPSTEHAYIVTFSGRTEDDLAKVKENFQNFLLANRVLPLRDISFTLNTGRGHFEFRDFHFAQTTGQLIDLMSENIQPDEDVQEKFTTKVSCYLFSGLGSQYYGMCQQLYETWPIFKATFDYLNAHISSKYGLLCFKEVIWGGMGESLATNLYSQTCLFVVQHCTYILAESLLIGPKPCYVAGHSVGEFNAAVVAGLVDVETALNVLISRLKAIEDACEAGPLLAVLAELEEVQQMIEDFEENASFSGDEDVWIDVAAMNNPRQTVVTSTEENIVAFMELLEEEGITCARLESNRPMHSREMDKVKSVLEKFPMEYKVTEGKPLFIPTTHNANPVKDKFYWWKNTRNAVDFASACHNLSFELQVDTFLELGPTNSMCLLVESNLSKSDIQFKALTTQLKGEEGNSSFLICIGNLYTFGYEVNWQKLHNLDSPRVVSLPTYPFNRKRYWFDTSNAEDGESLDSVSTGEPSNSTVFTKSLSLKEHSFLKDHKVKGRLVFPGAAWIVLIASLANRYGLPCKELREVKFHSPLVLEKEEDVDGVWIRLTFTQVEGSASVDPDYNVIAESKSGEGRWVKHATLTIKPNDEGNPATLDRSTKTMASKGPITSSSWEKGAAYDHLATLSYEVGNTFKSLVTMTEFASGVESTISIQLPADRREYQDYDFHPSFLDAVQQAVCFPKIQGDLILPVGIDRVTILNRPSAGSATCWVDKDAAVLFDGTTPLIVIEGMKTQRLQMTLKTEQASQLSFYSEQLVCLSVNDLHVVHNLPSENVLVPFSVPFDEKVYSQFCRFMGNTLFRQLQSLVLHKLNKFTAVDVARQLGVESKLFRVRLLRKFLHVLEEDSFLSRCGEHSNPLFHTFQCTGKRPADDRTYDQEAFKVHLNTEYYTVTPFLERVEDCFKDDSLASQFLFSPSSPYTASHFYRTSVGSREGSAVLRKSLETLLDRPGDTGTLRILEIGSGTGASTEIVAEVAREKGAALEYWFTDVGKSFLAQAGETFGSRFKVLRTHVFDVHKHPLDQGLPAHYFDMVLASHVLHVAPDLESACAGLHTILKPGGLLMMSENWSPRREIDLTIGYIEGYWSYSDFRQTHCCISKQEWKRLLLKTGYSKTLVWENELAEVGTIVGVASDVVSPTGQASFGAQGLWVVATDVDNLNTTCANAVFAKTGCKFEIANGGVSGLLRVDDSLWKHAEGIVLILSGKSEPTEFLRLLQRLAEKKEGFTFVLALFRLSADESETIQPCGGDLVGMTKVFKSEFPQTKVKIIDLPMGNPRTVWNTLAQELWGQFEDLYVVRKETERLVVQLAEETAINNITSSAATSLFEEGGYYIVTGGNGGLGRQLIKWMATKGAKHIAVISKSEGVPEQVAGSEIKIFSCASNNDLKKVYSTIKEAFTNLPLYGVFHLAGVVQDASIPNQTHQSMNDCMSPKADMAFHLHQLTKDEKDLHFFVLFSSISSLYGRPGQVNYTGANGALNSLSQHRRSLRLPSLSICWGQWGDVGMVAGKSVQGHTPFSTAEGLAALEKVLLAGEKSHPVLAVTSSSDPSNLASLFKWTESYFRSVLGEGPSSKTTGTKGRKAIVAQAKQLNETLTKSTSKVDRSSAILAFVKSVASLVSGQKVKEGQILHLDSLMEIEVVNFLQLVSPKTVLGKEDVKNFATTKSISEGFGRWVEKNV